LATRQPSRPDAEPPDGQGAGSDRKLLHAIFQQVPVALFLLGQDGTIRRANAAAAALIGASPGYATGRGFVSLVEPAARAAVKSLLAAMGQAGGTQAGTQALSCGLYGPAGVRPCQVTISPVSVRGDDDLLLVVAAIDRRTVKRRRVGVLADSAIILTPDELGALGLRKGPSRSHGGYADRDYYELST